MRFTRAGSGRSLWEQDTNSADSGRELSEDAMMFPHFGLLVFTTKTPRAPRKGRFKGLLCRPCGRDHRRLLLDLEERVVTGTSLRWIADSANRFLDQPDCRPLPYGFGFSASQPRTVTSRWSKPRVQRHRPLNQPFLRVLGVLVVNKTSRIMHGASRTHRQVFPRIPRGRTSLGRLAGEVTPGVVIWSGGIRTARG